MILRIVSNNRKLICISKGEINHLIAGLDINILDVNPLTKMLLYAVIKSNETFCLTLAIGSHLKYLQNILLAANSDQIIGLRMVKYNFVDVNQLAYTVVRLRNSFVI